jgi:hypothetical protein
MSEEYGENHFNAFEQPILYAQVVNFGVITLKNFVSQKASPVIKSPFCQTLPWPPFHKLLKTSSTANGLPPLI